MHINLSHCTLWNLNSALREHRNPKRPHSPAHRHNPAAAQQLQSLHWCCKTGIAGKHHLGFCWGYFIWLVWGFWGFVLFWVFLKDSNINKRHNKWGGAARWQWRLLSSCLPWGHGRAAARALRSLSTAATCGAAPRPCGEIVSFSSFLSPSSPRTSWKLGTTPESMSLIQKNPLNKSFISFSLFF